MKKKSSTKYLKVFFVGVLVSTLILSIQKARNDKYALFEKYIINNYYSIDNLYLAMTNTLNNPNDDSIDKDKYIRENFDNYIFNIVLRDINNYEDEHISKYNCYFNKEDADRIMSQINTHNDVLFKKYDDVIYLKISDIYADKTYQELCDYIDEYKKIDNYIIDLRGNTGGSIDELIKILSLFYPSDSVVYTEIKSDEVKEYKSVGEKVISFNKLIFLSDEYTASAAEMLMFNIKSDFANDVCIVGNKTFGKNFGYSFKQFNDGELLMFVSCYMGNSKGEIFESDGINPDYIVDDNDDIIDYALNMF